jgi:hypothetical protein
VEKKRISEKRFNRIGKRIFVVLAGGGIPFFFVHGVWGELLLKAYLLTTFLLFALLSSYWESTNQLWFWKAMAPIGLAHSGIVVGLAVLNFELPQIDDLPRMIYGFLAVLLGAEVLGSMRIIEAFRPKQKMHLHKPEDRPDETA